MSMTCDEYQRRAVALESPTNDTADVLVPFMDIANMIYLCRNLDLVKRQCFYTTKPHEARIREYDDFTNSIYSQALNLEERGLTFAQVRVPHRLLHALIGFATEVGELLEEFIQAAHEDRPIDLDNLREEFGDLEWYPAIGRDEAEKLDGNRGRFTQEAIRIANIAKLEQRYKKDGDKGLHYGGERDYAAEKAAMDAAVPVDASLASA